LRRRLIAAREQHAASKEGTDAREALAGHLERLLAQLEPEVLGLYAPMRGEFNAIGSLDAWGGSKLRLALPFALRQPAAMHYRPWRGESLQATDECGLPAPAEGPEVVPDVVLVPCVAFTRSGYRLGYGGGYFDRWLAAHPGVTAIGIAWSGAEIAESDFAPQAHDLPLSLVLTEHGVVE
jgi:5,10-methenyltetrahydrofolate synthetase